MLGMTQAENKKGEQNSPINGEKLTQNLGLLINFENLMRKKDIGTE
jgi:hypothetical protein